MMLDQGTIAFNLINLSMRSTVPSTYAVQVFMSPRFHVHYIRHIWKEFATYYPKRKKYINKKKVLQYGETFLFQFASVTRYEWMEHKAFEGLKLKLHNLEDYFRLVHYFGGWNMQSWCQWILPIFRITREVVQYTRWDKLEWQSLQIFRLDGREDITDQIGLQSSVWQTGITGNRKINYIFSFPCKLRGLASLEKQSKLPICLQLILEATIFSLPIISFILHPQLIRFCP